MTSQDHLTEGSCTFIGGSFSQYVTTHVKVGMFFICHVTVCLKAYVTLWVEASYGKVPPFRVGGYWSRASGDMKYLICHVSSPNHMIGVKNPHCMS